jgi:hypothetical protein
MSRFQLIPFLLLGLLLPASLPAASDVPGPHWQDGEILSRRTITPGHHNNQTRYVYRIKGGGLQYTVRLDRPLAMALYTPMKFAVSHKHLVVQDTDGSELKANILKKSEPIIRR